MSPLRESSSWTLRYENDIKIEPLRRFYLIFEGEHTEVKYFEGIDNYRKSLGISNSIKIVILHKEDEIKSHSDPKRLLGLINSHKEKLKKDGDYDKQIDQFVIVFDYDDFTPENFLEFVSLASEDNILAVTNPCFELWLILHHKNGAHVINQQPQEILRNIKVSNFHTHTSHLCSSIFEMNTKKNLNFEKLKSGVDLAIVQERTLAQTFDRMATEIGSNIGILIETMREDPRDTLILEK
ncbi:MAG TPA: RloB family protein [Bacilli bacterium]